MCSKSVGRTREALWRFVRSNQVVHYRGHHRRQGAANDDDAKTVVQRGSRHIFDRLRGCRQNETGQDDGS